jgi:hypothetical protein
VARRLSASAESLSLRRAANAAVARAEVVERVRERHLHRVEAEPGIHGCAPRARVAIDVYESACSDAGGTRAGRRAAPRRGSVRAARSLWDHYEVALAVARTNYAGLTDEDHLDIVQQANQRARPGAGGVASARAPDRRFTPVRSRYDVGP